MNFNGFVAAGNPPPLIFDRAQVLGVLPVVFWITQ
jgi:hypothetical protein